MLSSVILALFAITQSIKIYEPTWIDTNLSFYLMLFTVSVAFINLTKNSFSKGFCKCSDETKVEFMMGFKAFLVVFLILSNYKFNTLFDIDLEKAHERVVSRINEVLKLMSGKLELPPEFTYSIMATIASLMSFCLVRINIKYAYYFYVITKN